MVREKGIPKHRSELGIQDFDEENEELQAEQAEEPSYKDDGRRGRPQRQSYTIQFKKDTLDLLDSLTDCKNKWKTVADARNVNKSLVIKWNKARKTIFEHYERDNQYKSEGSRNSSRLKKRTFVNSNKLRRSKFPMAEKLLLQEYRRQKEKGKKMSKVWFKKRMKEKIARCYGEEEAGKFKASNNWFKRFKNRNNISLRRPRNSTSTPAGKKVENVNISTE